ncbi:MAG: homoserine dehydrogenase, partial [Rhodospirillales bacterium]|nr:homoserine dehydrogenase [Rhodospirillales bacterium]
EIAGVSALDKGEGQDFPRDGLVWYEDAMELAEAPDIDLVVELIGGSEGIAKKLIEASIAGGKHVVTANKALIAHHGADLATKAEAAGVVLAFEAAVAGGIPIVKALREGLAANRFSQVFGILNGTCNYILTEMRQTGRDFGEVLAEAQALGFAEADPSFDVDGVDAAHKLAILTSLAFGVEMDFDAIHMEGIRHVSALDIQFADELGYRIKLLGITRLTDQGIEQRVHPCMVPQGTPISNVEGVFNAVVVEGDFVETTIYEGKGAGAGPTASAVVADIADIARGRDARVFSVPTDKLEPHKHLPMNAHAGYYYVRLMVLDRPGAFADIAGVLRDNKVSMEAILQRGRAPGEAVPVVLTTHETDEAAMSATLDAIAKLNTVVETPRMIRIEAFD